MNLLPICQRPFKPLIIKHTPCPTEFFLCFNYPTSKTFDFGRKLFKRCFETKAKNDRVS